ncbi:MAG: V-type ATP synthase subunit D [Deltaproteobacteria bacterium]|uniref:V-type ATP synthase subunit D n=1 Tax=Candidatus Zymogenus saltonus TaxID=2844893 RepID=A0A9D8KCM3_9DELT|nr:V-type ATP synthase subunit D [Candidatus Zymogenus saltonus]
MANKLNVSPTKSNLIKIKGQLEFAKDGYQLLDQKREILVMEVMHMIEDVRRARTNAEEVLSKAYKALRRALMRMGVNKVEAVSMAVMPDISMKITDRTIMGVVVPIIDITKTEKRPYFYPGGTESSVDEAATRFREALERIVELTEVEVAVWRLAIELKKTQKRVNALENIFIPQYEETLKFLEDNLAEKEREAFFQMKRVKAKLAEKAPPL